MPQPYIAIGNEDYTLSTDDLLMPAKKDQAPPDLRNFKADAEMKRVDS